MTDMHARIAAKLDAIEREDGVRILLAVESGSRAWGFPSRDSDWDIRFLFVRPLAAYLSIEPAAEVIERPIDVGLDVGGWDLRKALRLLVGSNAAVLEWLRSPIVYRDRLDDGARLAAVAEQAAHLPALAYHYDRLARRAWQPGEDGRRRLKRVFYALRPALALRWMQRHATPPPMDLPALMSGLILPGGLAADIDRLRAEKAAGTESDVAPDCPGVAAFVETALWREVARPETWDRSAVTAAADAFLQATLGLQPLP